MKAKIARITDILRRDDGISGAMHYTEQISWILFLKFLNDHEQNRYDEAALKGGSYEYIINKAHRWDNWACPKDEHGKIDVKQAKTGDDMIKYVNTELFPYLKSFKNSTQDPKSIKYKIGAIFEYLDNKIASGHTLREVLDIIDGLNFQSKKDLFELSEVYESLLHGMGNDGGNSGEFYTPRAVIKAMVEAVDPQIGQTVYDGAVGSGGFLIQAFEHMSKQKNLSAKDWKFLQNDTFFGREKTPLAYVMGVMNMILHGIESPNIYKQNTLTQNIRDIQEKDRYDVILANPPFGGKEKPQIQQNFPVQASATELLFLQHFMKSLKVNGKAAIILPEGLLNNSNSHYKQVKKELLENFNLHTIVSLPTGVFLPYAGVKTNIIFFERGGKTTEIWYYEVKTDHVLTKNQSIRYEHFKEFQNLYKNRTDSKNSWKTNVENIKDYDLSAKNPISQTTIDYKKISTIIEELENTFPTINKKIKNLKINKIDDLKINIKEWKWCKLEEVVALIESGFACNKKNEKIDGYVHLRTNNISADGRLDLTSVFRIDQKKIDKKRAVINRNDILFNNTNSQELVGKTCLIKEDHDFAFSNHLTRIKTNQNMIPAFLVYYLQNLFKQGYFYSNCKRWIGQAGFSATKLKEIDVPVPSLDEQRKIINYLENNQHEIKELETLVKRVNASIKEIKTTDLLNIFKV